VDIAGNWACPNDSQATNFKNRTILQFHYYFIISGDAAAGPRFSSVLNACEAYFKHLQE